jgi:hypothetical protein
MSFGISIRVSLPGALVIPVTGNGLNLAANFHCLLQPIHAAMEPIVRCNIAMTHTKLRPRPRLRVNVAVAAMIQLLTARCPRFLCAFLRFRAQINPRLLDGGVSQV